MRLADLVGAWEETRRTRSRNTKREVLAQVLADSERTALPVVVSYLSGELRQRRTGLGWSGLRNLPAPADTTSLGVLAVDDAFAAMAALRGAGSAAARRDVVTQLFGRATEPEQQFLAGLVSGNLRQGALDALMLEAVAVAFDVDPILVRRAAMLGGSTADVAVAASSGGGAALAAVKLELGRPVRPMLAGSATTPREAIDRSGGAAVLVDTKLDGIRVQVHRHGTQVRVFTRSSEEITARLPGVVEQVRALGAPGDLVLDGEALLRDEHGMPRPFQETAARSASSSDGPVLRACFFDVLHHAGADLLDEVLADRLAVLERVVPAADRVPHLLTADPLEATAFFDAVVAGGGEGVVVKTLNSPYTAGQRGAAWVKVKPRHTLDLVVTAAEWGSGRRAGSLSNIHLAARAGDGTLVPLGKTFKGMTDEVLAWQTQRFLQLETARERQVVHVRPEQVVEVAFDGVQRSTRYPGGVVLRFARVLRYRQDKTASEIDTIDAVRALLR